jgi:HPt (histidine-containing phosphotransfer) domain-containing protein
MNSPEPVLDTAWIWVLAQELDSRATALEFITQFLRMLPARVARINHTLEISDRDQAMDAVLSLASSASMAGAHQLAQHCRSIGREVRAGNLATARQASLTLHSHATPLVQQITELLDHAGTGTLQLGQGATNGPVHAGP